MKLIIIIPAYNEELNIRNVVDDITANYPQYDYVIINDGSTDNTRAVCGEAGYNLLDLPCNMGLAGAIKCGMRYATRHGYDYAVQIDGDGQHDPSFIAPMVKAMEDEKADIVIGSRFVNSTKDHSARMLGSRLISFLIKLTTRHHVTDPTSGMRLFNSKMIRKFGYSINYGPEPDTIAYLINCGIKVSEVQVNMKERVYGRSYLSFTRSIRYMCHMIYGILLFQWFRKKESN